MSNTQYLGTNAGFYYYIYGGTTWRTFPLAVPLRETRASMHMNQYVCDSLDLNRRQVLNVESTNGQVGVDELVGTLRYNDDQPDLRSFFYHAMLLSGSTTYPLRYTTGLTTGTTSGGRGPGADVWLIEPMGLMTASMDRQRAAFGDAEITIRVRPYIQLQTFSSDSGARWY